MKRISAQILAGLLLCATSAPRAAEAPPTLERILPFVDELTVAMARLDLQRADPNAAAETVSKWALDGTEFALPKETITAAKTAAEGWLNAFAKAGGREVYVLFSLNDIGREPPLSVVVPVASGGDAEALRQLVASAAGFQGESTLKRGCVVFAPKQVLRRLDDLRSQPPANVQAAFAQAPPGLLQVVLLPYAGAGRVIEELMPTLPPFLGGGASTALSQGFRWASLSVGSPPDLSARLTVQLQTPNDAEALRKVALSSLDTVGTIPEVRKSVAQWDQVRALLTPSVLRDQLTVALNREQVETLLRTLLWPAVRGAETKAQAVASMNNLKQIGLAVHMYAADNKDQLPPHLAATLPYVGSPQVLLGPDTRVEVPAEFARWTQDRQAEWLDQHSPYLYVKPAASLKNIKQTATTVLAYEKRTADGAQPTCVLFVDGHVERMGRDAFEKLLRSSGAGKK